MSIRRTAKSRRVVAAVSMAAAFALAATACGGDDGGGETSQAGASSSSSKPSDDGANGADEDTAAGDNVDTNAKLAEAKGQGGLTFVVNQVKRDSGGFVTVQGTIKNEGDQPKNSGGWGGSESAVVAANPNSVAWLPRLWTRWARNAITSSGTRNRDAFARRASCRSSPVSRRRSSCSSRRLRRPRVKSTSPCRRSPPHL